MKKWRRFFFCFFQNINKHLYYKINKIVVKKVLLERNIIHDDTILIVSSAFRDNIFEHPL
jgi:hypothetical protein